MHRQRERNPRSTEIRQKAATEHPCQESRANSGSKTSPNDLFGHLGKWQTQTLKQKSWLKLCRGGSNEKFEPPRQNLRQTSKSMGAGDGGRPVACHACLTLMTPAAYRPIICFSRTASCKSCASGRSQPFYRLWRSNIYATASRSGQRTAFRTEFVVAVV